MKDSNGNLIICPRCQSTLTEEAEDDGYIEKHCVACSFSWDGKPISTEPRLPRREEVIIKPKKRIHGISSKESRRIYLSSPAGKRAQERYRHSVLYREAHARHRKTDKYKDTQQRFHEKQTLFMSLLHPKKPTCPLKLFRVHRNGQTHYDMNSCDYKDKDCKFGCMDLLKETESV